MMHEQPPLRVVSLLPENLERPFRDAAPAAVISHFASLVSDDMPEDAPVMIAPPSAFLGLGGRPEGWPFGLRWVHLLTAGLDGYPTWLFDGVIVTHSPGVSAMPVSEYCLSAILMASKRLPEIRVRSAGQWQRTTLRLIAGQMLGIVGFGAIGTSLASGALALGMTVQALRASAAPLMAGVQRAESLEALFASSDHIVLALPANSKTYHMVNHRLLDLVRPGAHLINVARGSLVDHDALLAALDNGRLSRATLDVVDPEPLPARHRLYSHPQVILTPHSAANDEGNLMRLAAMFAENLARFGAGAPLRHKAKAGTSAQDGEENA